MVISCGTFKSYVGQRTVPWGDCLVPWPPPSRCPECSSPYYCDNSTPQTLPESRARLAENHWLVDPLVASNRNQLQQKGGHLLYGFRVTPDSEGKNMTRPPETGTRNKKSVYPSLCGFAPCLSTEGQSWPHLEMNCKSKFLRE